MSRLSSLHRKRLFRNGRRLFPRVARRDRRRQRRNALERLLTQSSFRGAVGNGWRRHHMSRVEVRRRSAADKVRRRWHYRSRFAELTFRDPFGLCWHFCPSGDFAGG
eukprot:Gregarina_sp_Poly_1__406@NODE_10_length_23460_cov_121_463087_g8_i1_p22_GENE_NODE_10_length_23460_cov_121_463087_g8_i1NODE_10_length_23460_cov_121_463087_g8_i1_p22_ORF_typecomplete_len107_score1_44Neuropeptide_S/PF14993_6/66Neuropeptide_S/PF14993_6/1_1Neuropeptide_S/PF14993_6/9_5e03_NODE_10_length_23460_cov_121_463087_g8_i11574416064